MRRLTFLLLALILASYALHLMATAAPLASFHLRDGLLLVGCAALIFASNTPALAITRPFSSAQNVAYLALITLLALLLRGWQLATLPPDCLANECDQALALGTSLGVTGAATIFPWLAQHLLPWTGSWFAPAVGAEAGNGLLALRLTSALLGTLTIPLLYLAAQQLAPQGALLAALLLALNPWHLALSRSSEPLIMAPLLVALALWGLFQLSQPRASWWRRSVGALLLIDGGVALWWTLPAQLLALPSTAGTAATGWLAGLSQLLNAAGPTVLPPLADKPLLPNLTLALIAVGLAVALRHWRTVRLPLLWAAGLLMVWWLHNLGVVGATANAWLPLLPLLLCAAALALEELLVQGQQSWRGLIQPQRTLALLWLCLLALSVRPVFTLLDQMQTVSVVGTSDADQALLRYLVPAVRAPANAPTRFYAPQVVLSSPKFKLLLGATVASTPLQPLETALTDLLAPTTATDQLYLIPTQEQPLLDLLQQYYPGASLERQQDAASGQPLFSTLRVPAALVAATQGLPGLRFMDENFGGAAIPLPSLPTLTFDWAALGVTPPFSAQWQGTLLVPRAGNYTFAREPAAPESAATIFLLQLDGAVVLDSAQGQNQATQQLAQGFYSLQMSLRVGDLAPPSALSVTWQQGAEAALPIPATALHYPPLPNQGLLATYYAGLTPQGIALDLRKEPLVGWPVALPMPYNGQWRGLLAAARAGDYLLASLGRGQRQLYLDGDLLLDSASPNQPISEHQPADYSESLAYLTQGWHTLEVRFAPEQSDARLQLFWQPPGGVPALLPSTHLWPHLANGQPAPLPPAAPLINPNLGNEHFALSQGIDLWQPQLRQPSRGLPTLPLQKVWQLGTTCGNGPEQFNQPHGVALSVARQLLWVADTDNQRVQELTLLGTFAQAHTSTSFQQPFDVDLLDGGIPLVLDAEAQQLFTIDPTTNAVTPFALQTSFYHPRGLAVGSSGQIAVADTGGGRVVLLAPTGELLGEFGGQGTPLSRGQPVDALVTNGALWGVTAEDGRLWRLEADASVTLAPRSNTFDAPHLAALPNGSFWVSDPVRRQLLYVAPSGQPLASFITPDFQLPVGIATAQMGEMVVVAVADSAACSVSLWQIPAGQLTIDN